MQDKGITEKFVLERKGQKLNRVDPAPLVPTTLEEAPLRRMDSRALNALRERRADRHMIAFLILAASVLIIVGIGAVVVWQMFR